MTRFYPAHEDFIAPARARPQVWRLVLGLGLCFALYAGASAAVFGVAFVAVGDVRARDMLSGDTASPLGTLLLLATFLGMAIGPFLAARWLHKRPMRTVWGPPAGFWRAFFVAAAICGALYAVLGFLPSDAAPEPNLAPGLWLMLLPLGVVAILLQTGAEEALFRGYVQQQLAARFANPLIWMVMPACLFAAGHYQPEVMGGNAWIVVAASAMFGILAADLTAKTGNLGAAWGFHFANNAVGILFVAMDGPLAGLSLYTAPFAPMDTVEMRPLLYFNFVILLLTWGLIRVTVPRVMRR